MIRGKVERETIKRISHLSDRSLLRETEREAEVEMGIGTRMLAKKVEVDLFLEIAKPRGMREAEIKEEIRDQQVEIVEGLEREDDAKLISLINSLRFI